MRYVFFFQEVMTSCNYNDIDIDNNDIVYILLVFFVKKNFTEMFRNGVIFLLLFLFILLFLIF